MLSMGGCEELTENEQKNLYVQYCIIHNHALVCGGFYNKVLHTRWQQQQEWAVSQFWKLEDVGRAGSFRGLGGSTSASPLATTESLVILGISQLLDASATLLPVSSLLFSQALVCLYVQISPSFLF